MLPVTPPRIVPRHHPLRLLGGPGAPPADGVVACSVLEASSKGGCDVRWMARTKYSEYYILVCHKRDHDEVTVYRRLHHYYMVRVSNYLLTLIPSAPSCSSLSDMITSQLALPHDQHVQVH